MREIQFRAWDDVRGIMLSPNCLDLLIHLDGQLNSINDSGELMGTDFTGAFPLMQYTGIKDKNGKEIYEGDILMLNNNRLDLAQVCFGEFGVRSIETELVIDLAVGWHLKVIKTDTLSQCQPFCYDSPLNEYWIKRCEDKVIGNIYENPELLHPIVNELDELQVHENSEAGRQL